MAEDALGLKGIGASVTQLGFIALIGYIAIKNIDKITSFVTESLGKAGAGAVEGTAKGVSAIADAAEKIPETLLITPAIQKEIETANTLRASNAQFFSNVQQLVGRGLTPSQAINLLQSWEGTYKMTTAESQDIASILAASTIAEENKMLYSPAYNALGQPNYTAPSSINYSALPKTATGISTTHAPQIAADTASRTITGSTGTSTAVTSSGATGNIQYNASLYPSGAYLGTSGGVAQYAK